MADIHVEVLVEPFRENEPGPHVYAVVDTLAHAGLEPDFGPFATTCTGPIDAVSTAISDLIQSAVARGASAIQIRISTSNE
jgi:uncharacterized protein YqgV (UPF0045/DUF77 family)